jgi:hypothetical protein
MKTYHVYRVEERDQPEYIIHYLESKRLYRLYSSTIESWAEPAALLLEIHDTGDGWIISDNTILTPKKGGKLEIGYDRADQLVILTSFIVRSYNLNNPTYKIVEINPIDVMTI